MRTTAGRRLTAFAMFLVFFVGGAAGYNTVRADDAEAIRLGNWPTYGFLYMSPAKNYSGYLAVLSITNCGTTNINTAADGAFSAIKTSTKGAAGMSEWANGIVMVRTGCNADGSVIDYWMYWDPNQQNFLQSNGSYIGGRILHTARSSANCAARGVSYPCGHKDTTQYNFTKFNAGTSTYRQQLIVHESGHAHDLQDNPCQGPNTSALDNGGSCGWNPTQYFQYDRQDIDAQYPEP